LVFNDLDIKFKFGRYAVNVLYINYEPPIPGWGYGNHNHSSYELHFIPQGRGILEVNAQKYEIVPNTFFLTGPGIFHKQVADRDDPMSEYCINFEFKQYRKKARKYDFYLEHEVDEIAEVLKKTSFWFGPDEYGTIRLFDDVLRELKHHYLGRFAIVQHLVSQIIIKSTRYFIENIEKDYPLPKKITNDRRRLIVDKFFQKKLNDAACTPEALAEKIGVSIRQLNRIMQEYYSMTFKEKQTSFQIERAKELLRNSELLVKEVAHRSGYSNESYFCKIFKENVGLTPLEYRYTPCKDIDEPNSQKALKSQK
jgi:AraC-like DNA-binding protein